MRLVRMSPTQRLAHMPCADLIPAASPAPAACPRRTLITRRRMLRVMRAPGLARSAMAASRFSSCSSKRSCQMWEQSATTVTWGTHRSCLLTDANVQELCVCAKRLRGSSCPHTSLRRVLGSSATLASWSSTCRNVHVDKASRSAPRGCGGTTSSGGGNSRTAAALPPPPAPGCGPTSPDPSQSSEISSRPPCAAAAALACSSHTGFRPPTRLPSPTIRALHSHPAPRTSLISSLPLSATASALASRSASRAPSAASLSAVGPASASRRLCASCCILSGQGSSGAKW